MLGYWRPHADYQQFVRNRLEGNFRYDPGSLREYEALISKLWIMNTDLFYGTMLPCYSPVGRPSLHQPEILRVCLAMTHLTIPMKYWVSTLENNFVLRTVCGLRYSEIPPTGTFYDFISRIINLDERPKEKVRRKPKAKDKPKKGEKLPPKNPGVTARLVKAIKKGRRLNHRPERILQEIFAVIVNQSVRLGLVGKTLSVSGDGTCMPTGASSRGKRICKCKDSGAYQCDCKRKFSDPNATWGYDSHNDVFFYGYTGYFLSTYNSELKIDLPVYLRLVSGNRHDSISAVVALAEFRDLHPELTMDTFMSDSASDNNATYELLDYWGINAVIALNKGNSDNSWYKGEITVGDNGIPVCPAGHEMAFHGSCIEINRSRYKWRCPRTRKRDGIKRCDACNDCSPKAYGRVKYTTFDNDLRLHPRIPRHSHEYTLKMNERTASERINNTILNTYGIENSMTRGKKRMSFFTSMAATNIHLDAQVAALAAKGQFDFNEIFHSALCAA